MNSRSTSVERASSSLSSRIISRHYLLHRHTDRPTRPCRATERCLDSVAQRCRVAKLEKSENRDRTSLPRMIEATVSYRSRFGLKTSFIKTYATKMVQHRIKWRHAASNSCRKPQLAPLKTAASNCNHTPASSTKNQPAGVGRSWLNFASSLRTKRK
jgi:hypothetical protein